MNNKIDIFSLYEYLPNNMLSKFQNKNVFIYFICLIVIIFIAKITKNFSYVFICLSLLTIYIYYCQLTYNTNYVLGTEKKKKYLNILKINPSLLITKDDQIIELLHSALFIKEKSPTYFKQLINYIEDFLTSYQTLRQNINNIYIKKTDLIKPIELSEIQQSILINDIRDKLERVMKHIETMIFNNPKDITYLESYYQFYQLIRSHLSRYYNKILSDYNFKDHTSQYQLTRSSENKYDFLNK